MKDKLIKKPNLHIHFICGLIPDIVPIILPNANNILKLHLLFLFPAISLVIYFIRLKLYSAWAERYISEIQVKHKSLKIEYKKLQVLINKHESISNIFIKDLSFLSIKADNRDTHIINSIYRLYQDTKQNELGKYNRKDDIS